MSGPTFHSVVYADLHSSSQYASTARSWLVRLSRETLQLLWSNHPQMQCLFLTPRAIHLTFCESEPQKPGCGSCSQELSGGVTHGCRVNRSAEEALEGPRGPRAGGKAVVKLVVKPKDLAKAGWGSMTTVGRWVDSSP